MLALVVANRGNVTEVIQHNRLTVTLRRGRRVLARLQPVSRQLLPRTRGIVQMRYSGRVRGRVKAVVELWPEPGGRVLQRTYGIKL
jgi:hypothetical protein